MYERNYIPFLCSGTSHRPLFLAVRSGVRCEGGFFVSRRKK